jgi:hypothetical protein
MLAAKMGVEPPAPPAAPAEPTVVRPDLPPPPTGGFEVEVPDAPHGPPARKKGSRSGPPAKEPASKRKDDGNPVTDFLKSREGRATVNNVVRGVFDLMKKK